MSLCIYNDARKQAYNGHKIYANGCILHQLNISKLASVAL